VIKTLGADVLRLWAAASDYSGEISISDNLLKRIADAYRRIRNTARYLLASVNGFDPAKDAVPVDQMLAIDRWAIAQAAKLQEEIKQAYDESQFHLVYQKLHNYCVNDLGGLYLDVLKDRLYTLPTSSVARRSAQTAMFHISEAMVRWIAPILSFTADEIWQLLPGDRRASVFAQQWYQFPSVADTGIDWDLLINVRQGAKRVLEVRRAEGAIGSGLNADLTLYCDDSIAQSLAVLGDELRFWFITSSAVIKPKALAGFLSTEAPAGWGDAAVSVKFWAEASTNAKCDRCWHQRPDVGTHAEHPTLCGRCVENISGAGETRLYI
jgi:isoleucyl-tRNA synthetase